MAFSVGCMPCTFVPVVSLCAQELQEWVSFPVPGGSYRHQLCRRAAPWAVWLLLSCGWPLCSNPPPSAKIQGRRKASLILSLALLLGWLGSLISRAGSGLGPEMWHLEEICAPLFQRVCLWLCRLIAKAQHVPSTVRGDKHAALVKYPKRLFTTFFARRKWKGQSLTLRTWKEIEKPAWAFLLWL